MEIPRSIPNVPSYVSEAATSKRAFRLFTTEVVVPGWKVTRVFR